MRSSNTQQPSSREAPSRKAPNSKPQNPAVLLVTTTILKGWKSFSPRLRGTSYPGFALPKPGFTLKGLNRPPYDSFFPGVSHRRLSGWNLALRTWSFSGAWILVVGASLLLLFGCTAPIGAERVSARQAYGQVDANALRTRRPSADTVAIL